MENTVTIHKFRHSQFRHDLEQNKPIHRDDFCFYRFIGGNSSETNELIDQLNVLKDKKALMLGIFRFPFRFEGKRRMQTAIHQYHRMRELCDSVIFFHGDGMLEMIDQSSSLVEANQIFNSYEENAIAALEEMIYVPGEINIDARDIRTFIKENKGPIFLHTLEEDSFDEPLKYLISAPYLPENYTDGKEMIINIGYSQDVNMEAFRHINLRLHDMFHKAELVKLGSYFMKKPGNRFKITILVSGIEDPFPKPDDFGKLPLPSLWFKRKWELIQRRGKELKVFQSDTSDSSSERFSEEEKQDEEQDKILYYSKKRLP
ncbi:cell division protein FtsZ [Radiobacillus sp. PE A8.2]|uniref:cell division protein FtsZ n=1 Tax=Radiobacillus sp. PE A8.2 TaxID=3380349 RepID=UPI00388EDBC1